MAQGRAVFFGSDQFWVQEPELTPDVGTGDPSTGLVVSTEHGAVILTSEFMGQVTVEVDARAVRPAEADDPYGLAGGEDWDDVVEISLRSQVGPLQVLPLDDEVGLPRLDAAGPGDYRLRVHARNRDVHRVDADGFEQSTDEYRLVCWPEPPWGVFAIRLTDRRGADLRHSFALDDQHAAGHPDPGSDDGAGPAPALWPGSAPAGARLLLLTVEDDQA